MHFDITTKAAHGVATAALMGESALVLTGSRQIIKLIVGSDGNVWWQLGDVNQSTITFLSLYFLRSTQSNSPIWRIAKHIMFHVTRSNITIC